PSDLSVPMIAFHGMTEPMLFTIEVLVCLYFLVAYSIYAYPSYRTSKKKWKDLTSKSMEITSSFHPFHIEKEVFLSNSRFALWNFVSFYLPILMGFSAIVAGMLKIA
ncbi:MAG: hypothetical protein OEL79_10700, partial [Chromatiales bacterium]|nr:hypothetical protein [Chromatiales bacterium]